jgi:hypothetical protein
LFPMSPGPNRRPSSISFELSETSINISPVKTWSSTDACCLRFEQRMSLMPFQELINQSAPSIFLSLQPSGIFIFLPLLIQMQLSRHPCRRAIVDIWCPFAIYFLSFRNHYKWTYAQKLHLSCF